MAAPTTYTDISASLLCSYMGVISAIEPYGKAKVETTEYRNATSKLRRHVQMLDGIALLFITRANHQVIATGTVLGVWSEKIYWSANSHDSTNYQERGYYQALLNDFKQRRDEFVIMERIISNCHRKMKLRVIKILESFSGQDFELDPYSPSYKALQGKLWSQEILQPKSSLNDGFARLLRSLGHFDTIAISTIVKTIAFANIITEQESDALAILDHDQFRRLRKLGDYRKIVLTVQNECNKLSDIRLSQVSLEYVPCPSPYVVNVPRRTLTALNNFNGYFGPSDSEEIRTDAQIAHHFPRAELGLSGSESKPVTLLQHCELTVAHKLIELRTEAQSRLPTLTGPIEVGCSKASCGWCYKYLQLLNERLAGEDMVIARAAHDKRISGWRLPTAIDDVAKAFKNDVCSHLAEKYAIIREPHLRLTDSRSLSESEDTVKKPWRKGWLCIA